MICVGKLKGCYNVGNMAYRYRKSIRIAKGVKVNLTKTGVGMTVGGRGAHYSVHSSGRHTASVGIPGTGLSYVSSHKTSTKTAAHPIAQSTTTTQATHIPSPGLFASKGEKLIHAAIKNNLDVSLLDQAETIPQFTHTTQLFKALGLAVNEDKTQTIEILQNLHDAEYHPETDKIVCKYANASRLTLSSLPGINLYLTLSFNDLAIFLAELYRQQKKYKEASVLLHSVPDGFNRSVFVCRLCDSAEKYEPILAITNNLVNDSEQSMLLLIYRGVALGKTGHFDASLATFKEALRFPSRSLSLKIAGWRERGRVYLEAGKKSQARKDFEKVYAEDAEYPDIKELLAQTESR